MLMCIQTNNLVNMMCLPAVPHRSTLSVCSKGLVPYWDSLVVKRGQREIKDCCVMLESVVFFKHSS